MSSDRSLTPYNDQEPEKLMNNLVGSHSELEDEDTAVYIDNKNNKPSFERSRNDTIPEEPTISLEDISSQKNGGIQSSSTQDKSLRKAFYSAQGQQQMNGETKLLDSQALQEEQLRAEATALEQNKIKGNNTLQGI